MRKVRGFTLIELLVVMVIIGILVSIALPNYIKAKDKAREAQVQSNIHVIQLAVERYAVDNDGSYPKWLLGGDYSDWNTVQLFSPVYCPGVPAPSPPCGDGDALLEYGFLSQYPRNPFMRNINTGRNLQVLDCPNPRYSNGDANGLSPGFCDYGQASQGSGGRVNGGTQLGASCGFSGANRPSCRKVGGISNTLMWDVSEGAFAANRAIEGAYTPWRDRIFIRSRGWSGHPPWPILCSRGAAGCDAATSATPTRRIAPWLVGNFYYYPLPGGISYFASAGLSQHIEGYYLAGYGAIWNLGNDVYDAMGDYEEGKLFCDSDPYGDCVIDTTDTLYISGNATYRRLYCVSNGPDGQRDGVIVAVSSGKDRSPPMNTAKAGCGQ
ncbi:MAG: type II secretion system protein [bacterium]